MKYLLDSNVMIEVLRNPDGPLAIKLDAIPPDDLATSAVVAGEILTGPHRQKRRKRESLDDVLAVLAQIQVLPFDIRCAQAFAAISAQLQDAGMGIDALDAQIAATALAFELTLITHNTRHFQQITGLQTEDWEAE